MSRTVSLVPFLSAAGETALKPVKLLAVLTQDDLDLKFPDQTGPLALFCKVLAICPLLGLSTIGVQCYHELLPAISGQMGLEDMLHLQLVGLRFSLLALVRGGGASLVILHFPSRLSGWEGPGTILSPS